MAEIFQPNEDKNKETPINPQPGPKKLEPLVTSKSPTKPQPAKEEPKKFKDVFLMSDVKKVKNYIFMDVLVPALKTAVKDIITEGVNMLLYGDSGRTKGSNISASRTSYSRSIDPVVNTGYPNQSSAPIDRYDTRLITEQEARNVLQCMIDIIQQYGVVRIADLNELMSLSGKFTDNNYGWSYITIDMYMGVRDGYLLRLPKPMPIN